MVDALALLWRYVLISTLNIKLLEFEYVKDLYIKDVHFGQVYIACEHPTFDKFYRVNEYLFKEKKLCVSNCSMLELLVHEAYESILIGHFMVV